MSVLYSKNYCMLNQALNLITVSPQTWFTPAKHNIKTHWNYFLEIADTSRRVIAVSPSSCRVDDGERRIERLMIRASKMLRKAAIGLLNAWPGTLSCWESTCSLYSSLKPPNMMREFVHYIFLNVRTVSVKQKSTIILIALTAHHTPNFMSCNWTSYISLGLSVKQYVLFWIHAWLFKYNH
jgi:hypothetical protein